jgi:hypothetical protein
VGAVLKSLQCSLRTGGHSSSNSGYHYTSVGESVEHHNSIPIGKIQLDSEKYRNFHIFKFSGMPKQSSKPQIEHL